MSNEVIDALRSKYPDYQNVSDDDLTAAIGRKYPAYLENKSFSNDFARVTAPVPATATAPAEIPTSDRPPEPFPAFAPVPARIPDQTPPAEKPWDKMSFMEQVKALENDPNAEHADSEHSVNQIYSDAGNLITSAINKPILEATPTGGSFLGRGSKDPARVAEVKRIQESGLPIEKAALGLRQGADEFLSGLTSPLSIGTFGVAGILQGAPAVSRALSAWFAVHTGKSLAVDTAKALGEEYGKPEDQRDPVKLARLWTGAALNAPLTAALGTHALRGEASPLITPEGPTREDHLATLGLTPEATPADIKSAFRDAAKQYHPDVPGTTPEDHAKFQEALDAYTALTPPKPQAPVEPVVQQAAENNAPRAAAAFAEDLGKEAKPVETTKKGEEVLGTTGAPATAAPVPTTKSEPVSSTSVVAPPVPEKADSIAKQLEVTLDPASTKAVTLVTPGAPVPGHIDGLELVETKHGFAFFNPAKTTRDAVLAAAEGKDFDGTLLGMSQSTKPEPVGNTVVQTTKDGVPVVDEVVPPTPAAIAAASAAHAAAVPGGETTVKPADRVLEERKTPPDKILNMEHPVMAAWQDATGKVWEGPSHATTDIPQELAKDGTMGFVTNTGRFVEYEAGLSLGQRRYDALAESGFEPNKTYPSNAPTPTKPTAAAPIAPAGTLAAETGGDVGRSDTGGGDVAVAQGAKETPQIKFTQGQRVRMGKTEGNLAIYDDGRVAIRTDKGSEFPAVISKLEAVETKTPGTQQESGRVVSSPAEASPSPRDVTTPQLAEEIKKGDWIEYQDAYGNTRQGKVSEIWKTGRIIPGAGVQPPKISYSVTDAAGNLLPSPKDGSTPKRIDKTATEAQPASGETTVGQPGASASGMDVRKPAGTGATTQPEPATAPAPRPTEPASPEARRGTEGQSGNERGRGVRSGERGTAESTGRSGDSGRTSPGAGPVSGTGKDLSAVGAVEEVPRATRGTAGATPAIPKTEADQNHVLPQNEDWIPAGDKAKVRANLDAIQLLKKLEAEDRFATPEEKSVLAKYTGWGGLKEVFDEGKAAYRERPPWNEDQKKEFANWEKQWGKLYDEVGEALSPEEHRAAAGSILNAHYTSREVINGVWNAVERLGFKGGKALEPAAGVGNFIGLTPEAVRGNTQWSAVELDDVSGRILSKLYPEARTYQMGFQDAKIAPNSQDLVISNVPFAADGPRDKRYPSMSLHNYFIARAIDLVKPGGIVAAITSDSTMDNSGAGRKAREYFAEKADLIGALRLPNTAFKKNAGTEVTTDVLFFRKHDGTPFAGHPFKSVVESETYKGQPIQINEYFALHPEMMLGRMSLEGTMYRADQQALIPTPGIDLNKSIEAAVARLPINVMGGRSAVSAPEAKVELADKGTKIGALTLKDGKPFVAEPDGSLSEPAWAVNSAKVAQAKKYMAVRDATSTIISEMLDPNETDHEIELSRNHLNRVYDEYFKKYGAINERASQFLDDDVDFPLALALEDANTKLVKVGGKDKRVTTWTKSKLFTERTIYPRVPPEHVDTVPDAMQVSQNFQGKIDPDYIAKLTGKPVEAVKSELEESGQAFENPATGQWENRATFLSGFVKEKLRAARNAAESDPRFERQVQELEKIQPPPIAIENIGARLGSTWVPPEAIEKFIRETLQVQARVSFTPETGNWHVAPMSGQFGERNKTQYGIHDWKGHELVESALNLKSPVVTDLVPAEGGGTKEQKNPAKSLEAAEKQNQLQREFKKFILSDPETAQKLEQIYNDKFNGVVSPKFEAPTWAHYPGASSDIALREHQKAVVTRMLQNSTLLAHAVGTGKTYAMATAAMEMRRLGLAKKPMIVVQNATLEQFARAFKRLYPTARILAPNAKMRDAKNRNKTMARIATGDWDAVIIPQSFVNMLPDDPEREAKYISDRLDELEAARIDAAREGGKRSPKASDLQKAIKRLQERLSALAARKKDNVLTFEQLGVDALFVDEAHAYKKLEFTTQMDNIKGLDTSASQRGWSMSMKTRWVQEKNQGRNVIFATGTPVSNTIAEAWNMMRYVRPDVLKHYGIENFDAFASTFGDTITQLEMTAGGTWKPVTRFARFSNGPELIAAWRTVADVVTPEEINLPGLPALKNGKPTVHTIAQSPELKNYVTFLRSELERFAAMSGKEKRENSHIPLVVFGLAKKASLDMRMIDPTLPDQPGSKLNVAADEAARVYKESTPAKGTQMIFSDAFQDNPDAPKFNLYDEMKKKLIERGIPADQIAIITADVKDAKRDALFQKVIDGEVRVLLGSTDRMGVGVNVQEKLIALHHLDAPPRPMDIEQRNGRIIRQGNTNPVVEVHSYGVENTLDAAMFQKLATKQKFINQILRGDLQGRNFEDAANEVSLSFEEQMAAFSGDKRAMEKVALENQVRQLEMLRSGHIEQVRKSRDTIQQLTGRTIPYQEKQVAETTARAAEFDQAFAPEKDYTLQTGARTVSGRKDVAQALDHVFKEGMETTLKNAKRSSHFGDFTVALSPVTLNGQKILLNGEASADTKGILNPDRVRVEWKFENGGAGGSSTTGVGFFHSLAATLERIASDPKHAAASLANEQRNLRELEGFVKQPFEREAELQQARERSKALEAELKAEGEAKPKETTADVERSVEDEGSSDLSSGALGEVGMGAAKPGEVPRSGLGELIPPRAASPGEAGGPPRTGSAAGMIESVSGLFNRQNVGTLKNKVAGIIGTMAGRTFPKTTRLSRPAGEAAARYVSSKIAAPYIARVFARDVLTGLDLDPVKFGAALSEDNLRSVKAGNERAAAEAATPEEAAKFQEMADHTFTFVGEGKPFATEEEYQHFLSQTNVREAVARHISNWEAVIEPMYREAMQLDPDVELPARGEQTGARVNLAAIREGDVIPPGAVSSAGRGGLLNTLKRKSPFGQRAKGSGTAYLANYDDLIANSVYRQLEIANKNVFDQTLVEKGLAEIHRPGWQGEIKGEGTQAFPLAVGRRTVKTAEGQIISASKEARIYVRKSIAAEYRNAANVDENPFGETMAKIGNVVNQAALAGLTDVTVHLTNLSTALMQLPASKLGLLSDSLLAAAGRLDIPVALMRAAVKGAPEIVHGSKLLQKITPDVVVRALEDSFWKNHTQLAELATIGALKPEHPSAGLPGLRQMSDLIQWYDRTVRMVLDDAYQDLAARGIVENSETARREFINQVGQYNRRAQGALVRLARDLGTGPFVTAGRAFNVLGLRGALLDPGVKATNPSNAVLLRANAFAKWLGVFALVALINYLINGKWGGRKGTPLGSIDQGTNDEQGRMKSFSLVNLTGQGRALRVTGARGLIEAKQKGLPTKVAADSMVRDQVNSWVAPFAGPVVKFAFTAAAGAAPAINVGRTSKIVAPGENQAYENLWQAIKDANPVVAGIDKATEPGKSWAELVRTQLPRFTMQTKQTEQMMEDYPAIVRRAQANAFVEDVIHRSRYIEKEQDRAKFINSALDRLDPQDREHAERTLRFRKIVH